jgi:hypothetical protein
MVIGLDRFRDAFAGFEDRYAIIGGTACEAAFRTVGLDFRATKDIDVVLCLERLDPDFGRAVWSFVRDAQYESLEADENKRSFYRFQRPKADGYPAMVELFSRVPDALAGHIEGHLTPVPVGADVSSLSAILLDDDFYAWTHDGRVEVEGVSIVRPEHLIPLKARAWLDMTGRRDDGIRVDARDIKKHRNDVIRLHGISDPEYRPATPPPIREAMREFVERMQDEPLDPRVLGLPGLGLPQVLDALRSTYIGD